MLVDEGGGKGVGLYVIVILPKWRIIEGVNKALDDATFVLLTSKDTCTDSNNLPASKACMLVGIVHASILTEAKTILAIGTVRKRIAHNARLSLTIQGYRSRVGFFLILFVGRLHVGKRILVVDYQLNRVHQCLRHHTAWLFFRDYVKNEQQFKRCNSLAGPAWLRIPALLSTSEAWVW